VSAVAAKSGSRHFRCRFPSVVPIESISTSEGLFGLSNGAKLIDHRSCLYAQSTNLRTALRDNSGYNAIALPNTSR
jgi:hypothetical protein